MNNDLNRSEVDDLTAAFAQFSAEQSGTSSSFASLDHDLPQIPNMNDMGRVLDLPVDANVELGRAKLSIADLVGLRPGTVVELNQTAGAALDLVVNGCVVARGEVVIVNDQFGLRVTDILSSSERQYKMHG